MNAKLLMGRLTATLAGVVAACLIFQPAFATNVILTLDDGPCQVPLQADSSVTVDPTTGNLNLDVDDANLPTCFGSTAGTPLEVVVSVNPGTIDAGDSVTVSWGVVGFIENVTQCTATGGTSDWITDVNASPDGGSGTYSPSGNATFRLSCENSSDVDDAVVTVNGGSGNNGADGFPPPPALCGTIPNGRALPFNINKDFVSNPPNGQPKRNFADVWDAFPGTNEATIFIPENQYVAMPFYANQVTGKIWRMTWVGGPSNGNATQVSISRCPGDFTSVGYSDSRCLATSGSEGAAILTVIGTGNACPLSGGPNEVYYLNVRHAFASGGDACLENSGVCGFLGKPRPLN